MGYPKAKSLDCVVKIAKSPALSSFVPRFTRIEMRITEKNTMLFAKNIARRNHQFTDLKLLKISMTFLVMHFLQCLPHFIYFKLTSDPIVPEKGKLKMAEKIFQ